jgi:dolichol kinase
MNMILLEALIYNIIAIILPYSNISEHRESTKTSGSGETIIIFDIFSAINIFSSIVSTCYAVFLVNTGTTADRDGIIMGSTVLSSLALVVFDLNGGVNSRNKSQAYYEMYVVGWVVLSGFIFASLSTYTALSRTTNTTATTTSSSSPICSFLWKKHFSFYFWTSVHVIPLLLIDFTIIIITFFHLQHNDVMESIRETIIICHVIVIFQCYMSNQYCKSNKDSMNNSNNNSISSTDITRNDFTMSMGEWYTLSTFVFFLFVDFCHWIIASSSSSSPRPSHFIVAQSGIVGCFLGCCAATAITRTTWWFLLRHSKLTFILLHFLVIVIVTFSCIEFALRQQLHYLENQIESSSCYSHTYSSSNYSVIQTSLAKVQSIQNLPLHIKWIITFLLTENHDDVLPSILRSTLTTTGTTSSCALQETVIDNNTGIIAANFTRSSRSFTRGLWLLYWAIILLITLPKAIVLARYLLLLKQRQKKNDLVSTGRKLFHFIAVLLFGPVTWYAPSMMTLSYAVAVVFLVLLESLRLISLDADHVLSGSNSRNSDSMRIVTKETLCDNTKSKTGTTTTTNYDDGVVRRGLMANKSNQNNFGMNDFYIAFLDEKDNKGGTSLIITHIALIFGCALPQWIDAATASHNRYNNITNGSVLSILLPHIGVLVLGIGDAFGAIVGTSKFGRTKWPGSKRTLEGSAAMFLSMLLFVGIACCFGSVQQQQSNIILLAVFILALLTLLEASTMQIDNLCLPLVGATVILIFEKNTL